MALGSEQCLPSTVHVDEQTMVVGQAARRRALGTARMAGAAGPVAQVRVVAVRLHHLAGGAVTLVTVQLVEAIVAARAETRTAGTGGLDNRRASARVTGVREAHVLTVPAPVHHGQRVAATAVRAMPDGQTAHHAVTVTTVATTCAMAGCAVVVHIVDGRTLPVEQVVGTRRDRAGRVPMTADVMMTVVTDAATMGEVVEVGARMTGGQETLVVTAVVAVAIAVPMLVVRSGVVILADGEMSGVAATGEAIAEDGHLVRSHEPKQNAVQRRYARGVEVFVNRAQRCRRANSTGGRT